MKALQPFTSKTCLLACAIFSFAAPTFAAQRVHSERSTATPLVVAPRWRVASFPAAQVSRLQYQEMSAARILKVQQNNATRRMKPVQIGINRAASNEGVAASLPPLNWMSRKDGSSVARIEVRSPVAIGLRVGLRIDALDPRAELRFAGASDPARVVAAMGGKQILRLVNQGQIFWTPSTDGETQYIEVYLPKGVSGASTKLQAPLLSHLLTNSRNDFKIMEKVGESDACNVDTICRVAELGSNYSSAKNAVARMLFSDNEGSYWCTGTLLADTVTTSQIPYFYSANHCISTQDAANTLETHWKYEAATCGSGAEPVYTQLVGGALLLYLNPDTSSNTPNGTDGLLLRLYDTPPVGAEFAGWDSTPLANSSNIIGIHHPKGDIKKISSGKQQAASTSILYNPIYQNSVAWLSGTTEGGSSGSGLFTADATGYYLRGGLYGGSAECANSGSTANTQNRDYYSRFDVVFPQIRQWLAPSPSARIRVNGSQPRVPGKPAAMVPTTATSPVNKDSRPVRVRTRIYEP